MTVVRQRSLCSLQVSNQAGTSEIDASFCFQNSTISYISPIQSEFQVFQCAQNATLVPVFLHFDNHLITSIYTMKNGVR